MVLCTAVTDYKNIYKLIEHLDIYESESLSESDSGEFERSFGLWLISRRERPGSQNTKSQVPSLNGNIVMMLGFLEKYLDYYSRRLFRNSSIYSVTDFSFMMGLFPNQSLSKTELINICLMEKASGIEVIKRLIRNGLILEGPYENKIRKVRLSPAGIKELGRIMPGIDNLSKQVTGKLSNEEKETLLQILSKLHYFHKHIFDNHNEEVIRDILQLDILENIEKNK